MDGNENQHSETAGSNEAPASVEGTKTTAELTGTNRGTYAEAVESSVLRKVSATDEPRPDAPTGAAVHVNPAIDPAPAWVQPERPAPVPVINDPGVVGTGPTLQQLNDAARVTYGLPEVDRDSGNAAAGNHDEIRNAALAREQRAVDEAKKAAATAVSAARPKAESKF